MVAPAIDLPILTIGEFCRRNHIRKVSLFGSVLRPDFRPASDVDVLVEFAPGCTPGLGLIDTQEELSALLAGRRVDLVTENFLNSRIRSTVLAGAMVVFEK